MLQTLRDFFFRVPPPPTIDLGWAGKIAGGEGALKLAFSEAYWVGVKDGLICGIILTLALIVALTVMKSNFGSGLINVLKSL